MIRRERQTGSWDMAASSFTEEQLRPHAGTMLAVARQALVHSATWREVMPLSLENWPLPLLEMGASFVTLRREGQLRGCIGSLVATEPLLQDIVHNTDAAARRDPRFPPVEPGDLASIRLDVSVLTPPEPMRVHDENDLLNQLRPGVDGLILQLGNRRATFLPSVWVSLAEPKSFLEHLRLKAGLPGDFWTADLSFSRYEALIFEEPETF